jgi:hypothetical protein
MVDAYHDAYSHGIMQENDVLLSMAWERDMDRALLTSGLQQAGIVKPGPNLFRHLLILMGKGEHIRIWMDTVLADPTLQYVDIVSGVFDSPVETLSCPQDNQRVTCISVQGTTWTEGRNLLAKEAFEREYNLHIKYSFWTFADADVSLTCINPEPCFGQYHKFLVGLPVDIMAAVTLEQGQYNAQPDSVMVELQGFDAALNSFRREAIPVLIPYVNDQDSNTWWSSQAIFWNRIQCLHPYYAVTPLFIFYQNPDHNPYPRNPRNFEEETVLGNKLMGALSGILPRAPREYIEGLRPERIRPWPLRTSLQTSNYFSMCANEFAHEFYSFVSS